ncbi:MAG: GrpB family protein [Clostridia bacterium]|nr:GrpB family protein [Clostridia bacterium]
MAGRVTVVPYDENWKRDFERIKNHIMPVADGLILRIEHVGSTSVEGLCAKPIIDIDAVIKDYSVFDALVKKLSEIGYVHEGNLGIKDREAFDYRGDTVLPKHHLYVCPVFSAELRRHVSFRDYLRENREDMVRYSRVKEEGARMFPDSIEGYIAHKSPCIEEIYEKINCSKR